MPSRRTHPRTRSCGLRPGSGGRRLAAPKATPHPPRRGRVRRHRWPGAHPRFRFRPRIGLQTGAGCFGDKPLPILFRQVATHAHRRRHLKPPSVRRDLADDDRKLVRARDDHTVRQGDAKLVLWHPPPRKTRRLRTVIRRHDGILPHSRTRSPCLLLTARRGLERPLGDHCRSHGLADDLLRRMGSDE